MEWYDKTFVDKLRPQFGFDPIDRNRQSVVQTNSRSPTSLRNLRDVWYPLQDIISIPLDPPYFKRFCSSAQRPNLSGQVVNRRFSLGTYVEIIVLESFSCVN